MKRWSVLVAFPNVPPCPGMAIEEWVCGKEVLTLAKTYPLCHILVYLRDFIFPVGRKGSVTLKKLF